MAFSGRLSRSNFRTGLKFGSPFKAMNPASIAKRLDEQPTQSLIKSRGFRSKGIRVPSLARSTMRSCTAKTVFDDNLRRYRRLVRTDRSHRPAASNRDGLVSRKQLRNFDDGLCH